MVSCEALYENNSRMALVERIKQTSTKRRRDDYAHPSENAVVLNRKLMSTEPVGA